ncbi:LysM domain-containing protein [Pyrenophora tritici-repentis]|uniref:Uncharacterized protein n=1 Tax=Pyrenophora tritici-repentis TaxID=45151 RepID=A0A5M9KYX4_9PLEO|nr:LysM domain-containing protein [Pyrenophora tritici-repentis]KAF7446160.1 LysM domain-containing protein [Pyrenophora tritici-repentis]KAF7567266.1 hypothetical protein PtrM4_138570 [Pyrenophora tritici-repentis]KAI0569940.1 LysM domain-containing protein [Pyrenophora tritici-repentis]KAI0588400.1 LysM domain-containing protein [Pyrenophora tritici-repentis]
MQLTYLYITGLLAAFALAWPAHLRRAVDCAFSTAPADQFKTCESMAADWAISIDKFKQLNSTVSCPT